MRVISPWYLTVTALLGSHFPGHRGSTVVSGHPSYALIRPVEVMLELSGKRGSWANV